VGEATGADQRGTGVLSDSIRALALASSVVNMMVTMKVRKEPKPEDVVGF
jgi:hypothetical protein